MKNDAMALNNILMEQLERLMDDELLQDKDAFEKEMKRAHAVSTLGRAAVENHRNMLTAAKLAGEYGDDKLTSFIGIEQKKR